MFSTITIIVLSLLLILNVVLSIMNVRDAKQKAAREEALKSHAFELSEEAKRLEEKERKFREELRSMRPHDYFEKVTIAADKNPTKKKARKLLASKFGYDVIDLIKIHEHIAEDGEATYCAEFHINVK